VLVLKGLEEARRWLLGRPPPEEELPPHVREKVREVFGADLSVQEVVAYILADVRAQGDEAVARYNHLLDGLPLDAPLVVTEEEILRAWEEVPIPLREALQEAARRVEAFHRQQLENAQRAFQGDGAGQVVRPLERVGIYVPGSVVSYPSTVLMTAIPARVAGVGEVVMATPARPDGRVAPEKLVAARLAGVSRVFRAGGVQGIAALAYGTATVPPVDKICGPGNIFVATAKRLLFGQVGIDGIFGPSETVIVADDGADPALLAVDMLAGAEHDELATVVLIVTQEGLLDAVQKHLEWGLPRLARREVAQRALAARGAMVALSDLREAMELANALAPEHLCLHVREPRALLPLVRNVGCVFLGPAAAESLGDYVVGPSHVLPTGGSARFSSPLGVWDFLKVITYVDITREEAGELAPLAAAIARAEGLTGHAAAVEARRVRKA
jgi:histidinol dehydrogenase